MVLDGASNTTRRWKRRGGDVDMTWHQPSGSSPIVSICSPEILPLYFVLLPQVKNVVPGRERKPGPDRGRR